ncbi:Nose resistant to fluoxetine protein 6 [Amphibalanus amphitrite]|uniref:Nose resistant to fluoxetine protein 6 n=1 Tax=Amphibalanus amphitrite TaxID=1232801 RepID=A0A6A4WUW8_AMPAM|nr:Nose resistant to fluoxetine protein 6 [Amphibalanus amphitrite]
MEMATAARCARPRRLLLLLAPLLLASLLTPSLAVSDPGLPTELGTDWDWEFLNLWPRLLHIRRQFDRHGFPVKKDVRSDTAAGNSTGSGVLRSSGVLRTLELEDEDGVSQTAEAARRRAHEPTPRDEAVARTLGPFITPIASPQLSAECYTDTRKYLSSIFSEPWALRMFDATGKLPDGILSGNLFPGLLVAYIAMRNIERANGKLNIVMYYVHRYIRLTPVLMAVIGCVATLETYLGSGPWWSIASSGFSNSQTCRDNWWKNMLYINNLVDMERQCVAQTWYMANDMQMFLFSPLILLPLYHWPVLGQLWIILLVCFFTGINAMVTAIHKLGPTASLPGGDDVNLRYMKPWTRAGPYLVGLYMGWVLHKIRGRKIVLPVPVVAIGWLTASLTACLIVYGLFDQPTVPPQATNIIYPMLSRTAWSVCLAWVVFACVTGYGGVVNSILSWKALIPLSRITYTSYLVSIDVQVVYWLGNKSPQYLDHLVLVYQFLGSLPVIFTIATMFSLAFESPMLALEKLMFPQRKAPPTATAKGPSSSGVSSTDAKLGPPEGLGHINKTFDGDTGDTSTSGKLQNGRPIAEVTEEATAKE